MCDANETHRQAKDDKNPIALVRQKPGEAKGDDRLETKDLRGNVVRYDGRAHDRDDEGRVKGLVNLLEGKHDARQRGMESGRHAGAGPAGDKQALLSPSTSEKLGDGLSRHASQLYGRTLASQGEAAQGREGSLG